MFVFAWHLYVQSQTGPAVAMDPEYAKLMGATAKGASAMPGPLEVGKAIWKHFANPFYDVGPNDKGIGIQLAYSLGRVMAGFLKPGRLTDDEYRAMQEHVQAGVRICSPLRSQSLSALSSECPQFSTVLSTRSCKSSSRFRRSPGCRLRSTPSKTPVSRRFS